LLDAMPFRSAIRKHLKGHTQALEDLAIEMLARGLSVRDILILLNSL
jgi:putative transposase